MIYPAIIQLFAFFQLYDQKCVRGGLPSPLSWMAVSGQRPCCPHP